MTGTGRWRVARRPKGGGHPVAGLFLGMSFECPVEPDPIVAEGEEIAGHRVSGRVRWVVHDGSPDSDGRCERCHACIMPEWTGHHIVGFSYLVKMSRLRKPAYALWLYAMWSASGRPARGASGPGRVAQDVGPLEQRGEPENSSCRPTRGLAGTGICGLSSAFRAMAASRRGDAAGDWVPVEGPPDWFRWPSDPVRKLQRPGR